MECMGLYDKVCRTGKTWFGMSFLLFFFLPLSFLSPSSSLSLSVGSFHAWDDE